MDADNAKERGWILKILNRMYPDSLDRDTLKKQLVELKFMTSEHDIRSNIAYLQDKGLVKIEEVGAECVKRVVVRLTAEGKDLADGIVKNVLGVDI